MDILYESPWWVYVLFVFLVILGFKASQPRTISLKKLILLPGIFTVWNIAWLTERLEGRYNLLVFWGLGIVVGSIFGWQTVRKWKIKSDHVRKHISLPGTWSTLTLILLVFAARYFFVYNYETQTNESWDFHFADSVVSGLITGIFIGRSLELYKKYCEE